MFRISFVIICLSFFVGKAAFGAGSSEDTIIDYVTSKSFPKAKRSIDGFGNNKKFKEAGTPFSVLSRLSFADYADGKNTPADRTVNAREISVNFFQQEETQNPKKASDFLWLWGQFMDHDITLSDTDGTEHFNIAVPKCDVFFDISCSGTNEMPFTRSEFVMVDGVRQQFNRVTAYVDGSMVYGSDDERANALRAHDGSGRLLVDENGYLPKNTLGLPNLPSDSAHFFAAGDIRVNDHIGLMAMHNLFVREHNYWADQINAKNPRLHGNTVYQKARAIVIAEIQSITYNEFLPMLIGGYAPEAESNYNKELQATIFNEFSAAAFRMGHTFVSGELYLESMEGLGFTVDLKDSFFNPHEFQRAGLDSILLGFSKHMAQDRDPMINTSLQNFLLVFPHEGIFDLFSFNLQRGRDHGIPSFNDLRENEGFSRMRDFSEVTEHGHFNHSMSKMYPTVDDIDPWLGLISERATNNSLLGTTASSIISKQFVNLRDADRFWFTHAYSGEFADAVKDQTLAKILVRNSAITNDMMKEKSAFLVD
jgi:hypothetical protein